MMKLLISCLALTSLCETAFANTPQFVPVCERTRQIREVLETEVSKPCSQIGLTDLGAIEILHVSGRQIERLRPGDFSGLTKLIWLNLAGNSLRTIEPEHFQGPVRLRTLNLEYNLIAFIPSGTFTRAVQGAVNPLASLGKLVLNNNPIRSVDAHSFQGLTELRELDLSTPTLLFLAPGVFSSLPALAVVRLTESPLTQTSSWSLRPDVVYIGLPQRFGSLSDEVPFTPVCARTRAVKEAIERAVGLPCSSVTEDVVADIRNLSFEPGVITELNPGDFTGLGRLSSLIFTNQPLTRLRSRTFVGLTRLQALAISATELHTIDGGAFRGLYELNQLNLTSNRISSVENGDFFGLMDLLTLDLSMNRITSLESGDFTGLSNLVALGLGGRRHGSSLQISMAGRPLPASNVIRELRPDSLSELVSLQTLSLDNENLEIIPDSFFVQFKSLKEVSLNGAPLSLSSRRALTGVETIIGLRPDFSVDPGEGQGWIP